MVRKKLSKGWQLGFASSRMVYVTSAFALVGATPRPSLAQATPRPAVAQVAQAAETKGNAEEFAAQAYEAYRRGDNPLALAQYQRAFHISAAPVLLFNMAHIYDRKLHDREVAADYYRRYLKLPDADPELVKRANERLAALKREEEALANNATLPTAKPQGATPKAEPEPTANATPAARDDDGSTLRFLGLGLGGAGLVGITLGVVAGLNAKSNNDDAAAQCPANVCRSQQGVTLTNDAKHAATLSSVGFVVGGALLTGGALLFVIGSQRSKGDVRVGASLTPQVAGLSLSKVWP